MFSILDDLESGDTPTSNIVSPNSKRRKVDDLMPSSSNTEESGEGMEIDELLTRLQEEQEEEDEDIDESPSEEPEALYPRVPVVNPRRRYTGARNVETVKDGASSIYLINFLSLRFSSKSTSLGPATSLLLRDRTMETSLSGISPLLNYMVYTKETAPSLMSSKAIQNYL